jgi:Amt family ammonium transporter
MIGVVAGLLTTVATIALERAKLDDAVGAVPVHLVNGWWGTLCVALFDEAGFTMDRLSIQALGTFSISATAFVLCFGLFKVVDLLVGLRASDNEQIDGLDFSEHAANAYPDFQTSEQV